MPPCSRGRTRRPPREGRGLWEQGRRPRRTTLPHLKQVVCRFPRRGWGGGGVYTGGCEEGRGRTAFKKPGAPAFLSRPGCEVALLQREDFSARGLGRGLTPWPERASPAPPPLGIGLSSRALQNHCPLPADRLPPPLPGAGPAGLQTAAWPEAGFTNSGDCSFPGLEGTWGAVSSAAQGAGRRGAVLWGSWAHPPLCDLWEPAREWPGSELGGGGGGGW